MLRKISNWHIEREVTWFSGDFWRFYYTKVNPKKKWKAMSQSVLLSNEKYQELNEQRLSGTRHAVKIMQDDSRNLFWAKDGLYWTDADLSDEEVNLLFWEREQRQKACFNRLRDMRVRDDASSNPNASRKRIPGDLRAFVWRRDQGRCVHCGSRDDLQFDHVIPVSKGGGNSADNIQVLCAECNRRKSDNIGA